MFSDSDDDYPFCCPICDHVLIESDESDDVSHCPHIAFIYLSDLSEFDTVTPEIEAWWDEQVRQAEENDEDLDWEKIIECPLVDEISIHAPEGMACGPCGMTVVYGFTKQA